MTEAGFLIFSGEYLVLDLVKILQLTRSSLSTSSIAPTIVNTAILVNIIKSTCSTLNTTNLAKENTLIMKLLAAPVSKVAGMMM